MRRREFVASLGGVLVCPAAAEAQQRKYRMAYVTVAARLDTDNKAMLKELRQLGYVEGKNLERQRYSTQGSTERRDEIARAAVRERPDVIFVLTGPLTQSVRSVSSTIPIEMSPFFPPIIGRAQASDLRIVVPPSLLARADEVIE